MPSPDGRSPIAIGFERATRISVIGVMFVVPILIGHWVDRTRGLAPVGLLVGMVVGVGISLIQLIQLARGLNQPRQ